MFSTGVECNPVAVAIARAKLPAVSADAVTARAGELLAAGNAKASFPEDPFWQRCFAPGVLDAVCCFRAHFSKTITTDTDVVLCALLLGLLQGPSTREQQFSNIMPASYAPSKESLIAYWTANRLAPPEINVLKGIEKRAQYLLAARTQAARGKVILGDSRSQETYQPLDGFDWVITSPPYFGLNSFIDDQWLRRWFLGNPTAPDCLLDQTDTAIYMRDLARVWRECAKVCRPGARLIVRFGGVPGVEDIVPRALLENALKRADAGWRIEGTRPVAVRRRRPSARLPFPLPAAYPFGEFELFARLVG